MRIADYLRQTMASLNLVSSYGSVFRPLSAVFVAPWVTPTVPCRRCKRCRCRCRGLSSGSCSIMWRSFIDAAKYSGPKENKNRWRQTLPLPNRRMQISRSHALQTDLTTGLQSSLCVCVCERHRQLLQGLICLPHVDCLTACSLFPAGCVGC